MVRALQADYFIADYLYDSESQLARETLVNEIIYCGGVNNLRALARHPVDYAPVTPTTNYLGTRSWLRRYADHEWEHLLLLCTCRADYKAM